MPPAPRTWDRVAAIAIGGAAGAACRWAVLTTTAEHRFPWSVLAVNVVGSLLLGMLLAAQPRAPRHRVALHDAGAIGFCGGLTTFSTFAVEIVDLLDDGDVGVAVAYAGASVAGAGLAVVAGAAALRRLRAVAAPVEQAP